MAEATHVTHRFALWRRWVLGALRASELQVGRSAWGCKGSSREGVTLKSEQGEGDRGWKGGQEVVLRGWRSGRLDTRGY